MEPRKKISIDVTHWLSDSTDIRWTTFLDLIPLASRDVFFEPAYLRLYENADKRANCFIYCEDEKVFVYPFLLQNIQSNPGLFDVTTLYGYGGPVSNVTADPFNARAYEEFRSQAFQKGVIAELIKFHPLLESHSFMGESSGCKLFPECSVVFVDLKIDEQNRWQKVYTHSNRKNIRKAVRSKITIHMSDGDDEWEAFEDLYGQTMDANNADGFYRFSNSYFSDIRELPRSMRVLVTAKHGDVVVAAMIVFLSGNKASCHLIGTERSVMKLGVNNLLHHELILWCVNQGYDQLLIGGGRSNSDEDSLLRFKKISLTVWRRFTSVNRFWRRILIGLCATNGRAPIRIRV